MGVAIFHFSYFKSFWAEILAKAGPHAGLLKKAGPRTLKDYSASAYQEHCYFKSFWAEILAKAGPHAGLLKKLAPGTLKDYSASAYLRFLGLLGVAIFHFSYFKSFWAEILAKAGPHAGLLKKLSRPQEH